MRMVDNKPFKPKALFHLAFVNISLFEKLKLNLKRLSGIREQGWDFGRTGGIQS